MLTPERLQILHQKYNEAKSTGLHQDVGFPLPSFASELVGLFVCKARATEQFDRQKKTTPSIVSSLPMSKQPSNIAQLVTQEKIASPLDFNPDLPHYRSSRPRDTIWCLH